ncbi:hypothetical protein BS47DRAFT_1164725 [Hydnum rufescens UP504]|uniref:Uncharacterized protein n=1 Tax=Hydnum rufescens UP504 TaxID=1448309 RepID=A0A9P6DVA7_9AGAM|nr:hypothetical protein BS47DRAFT_1164725 [Hydnum rufescens UP504]
MPEHGPYPLAPPPSWRKNIHHATRDNPLIILFLGILPSSSALLFIYSNPVRFPVSTFRLSCRCYRDVPCILKRAADITKLACPDDNEPQIQGISVHLLTTADIAVKPTKAIAQAKRQEKKGGYSEEALVKSSGATEGVVTRNPDTHPPGVQHRTRYPNTV